MSRGSPVAENEEPRRGGRVRKTIERFEPGGDAAGVKGKQRRAEGSDDDASSESGESDDESPRPLRTNKRAANGVKRKSKGNGEGGSAKKAPRKRAAATNGDAEHAGPDAAMKSDSALFNALLSPDIALNAVIEEWVENYQSTAGDETSEKAAVLELILFCVRCCGLSAELDEDEVMDIDGIRDVIERIQDESIQTSLALYPLVNKAKSLRAFRQNLNLFVPKLIKTLSETPLMYETPESTQHTAPILSILLNWLLTMSSSPLRPIRHTSAYIALKVNSAICDVAVDVTKELALRQRQKEAEARKGNTAAIQKKVKEAEKKVKESHERKVALEEYMKSIDQSMFVHRIRDSDAAIRSDCMKELGVWIKNYGERYISNSYLNYFTRGCNDPEAPARLETIKALVSLFSSDAFASKATTFTLRLAPRVVEMALRDIDLPVRVHAINVITRIDKSGILADDDSDIRQKIARLVFDKEPRIRRAVAEFMKALWEERVEVLQKSVDNLKGARKKRTAGISDEEMKERIEWKALAAVLVETSDSLDEDAEASNQAESTSAKMSRATAAVEALSTTEMDKLDDWQSLVDYLMLDHSTAEQDAWVLEDEEEDFMLQVLIACIKQDQEGESEDDEKSKTLMKVLPSLFKTHQSDVHRLAGILGIPEHMNLSLYLDMRMSIAYEALWADISKHFLTSTSPTVLTAAIRAINHLAANSSMAASNTTHLTDISERLFSSLRDTIGGAEVADVALTDDQVATLETILLRISLLSRGRDLVEIMQDTTGGQSSGWDIITAFAERGELGYKEEPKLVEHAIQIIFLHLTWLFRRFSEEVAEDEGKVDELREKRDRAVDIFQSLAIKARGNPTESVRRQAFITYLNIHVLFSHRSTAPAAKAAVLKIDEGVQHRLGGAFQSALERFTPEAEDEDDGAEDADKAEERFQFYQLVSVFVAAIRTGVLEVDHAKEPLAYYGRVDPTFDAIVKKLVDVLRDEGIYNREAETVQQVAMHALQNSFSLFLESDASEPTATLTLARVIESAFIIRGTQFTILKSLHPREVSDFHNGCIDYVFSRVSKFVTQEKANKNRDVKARLQARRVQALTFFKVLALLLNPLNGREALKVKSHLEDALEKCGVPLNSTKTWDSYRAYEKRLVGIASRDTAVTNASRNVVATQTLAGASKKRKAQSDDELEDDVEEDREESPVPPPRTSSQKQSGKAAAPAEAEANGNGEEEEDVDMNGNDTEGDEAEEEQDVESSDVDLNIDLDADPDMAMFDIPILPPSGNERGRTVSVEPVQKKRKAARKL